MKWEGGQLRRKVGQSLGMGKSYTRARIGESSKVRLREAGRVLYVSAAATLNFAFRRGRCCVLSSPHSVYVLSPGRKKTREQQRWKGANFLDRELCLLYNERKILQRFRVRQGLSCVNGLFWPVRASCFSQAALSLPHSKAL